MKTLDNVRKKPADVGIGNMSSKNSHENSMVNARKKLLDIAFKHVACTSMVFGCLAGKTSETVERLMGAFVISA